MRKGSLVAALLLIAACAGEGTASNTIATTISEFAFTPSTWTVTAGSEVSVELTNAGTVTHEWVVLDPGTRIATEAEFREDLIYFESEVAAGDTATFGFTAPEAGEYQVICAIASHFDAGMEGTLTVTSADG